MDPEFPPGTVRIEDLSRSDQASEPVLQPRPTSDPNDPLNWPLWLKNLNFGLCSYYVLMIFALIDVATVTWAPVHRELGFSFAVLNDSYAAGCGALAVGAIILVPFSLKLGRRPIYVFSTAAQCGLSVWLAKMQNVADLMGPNVLTCIVGALAEVMVQMTVADIYFVHQRGLANTVYYWVMTVGVSLSPLAGGYITSSQGWRWVWWWMVILLGAGFVAFLFFYEETMFPRPIDGFAASEADAVKQPPEKEDPELPTTQHVPSLEKEPAELGPVTIDPSIPKKSYRQKLALWSISPLPWDQAAKHAYQPLLILLSFPGVFFMALEYGVMTACTTVPVTTLSAVMPLPPYNFGPQQIGLMGIPPFIGVSLATLVTGPVSDRLAIFLAKRNRGIFEPEMRLWLALGFTLFVPAGLFMFGIGLNNGSHWLLPAFGLGVSAFGIVPASSAALTYLTDAYTDIIADSVVGVTFIRNIISTIFVFAQTPWIDRVGLNWFYITFGLIVTVIMLGNLPLIYFGKRMRYSQAGRYRRYAAYQ